MSPDTPNSPYTGGYLAEGMRCPATDVHTVTAAEPAERVLKAVTAVIGYVGYV
jgi:hypothetical protein